MKCQKKIWCWLVIGCLLYLGLPKLSWSIVIPQFNSIQLNPYLRPTAQADSIPLPVYSIGDFWRYNISLDTVLIYPDHTEVVETQYSQSNITVIGIEQIRDLQKNEWECYAIKTETGFFLGEPVGSTYSSIQEFLVYQKTQDLWPVKFKFQETIWTDSSIDRIFSQNSSCIVNSTAPLYPLEPNKTLVSNSTMIANISQFYDGTWHISAENDEFIDTWEYTMTSFSNIGTVLGEFSGIKVDRKYAEYEITSLYYSQNIGSYIRNIYNSTSRTENFLYIETADLIEFHYTSGTTGFKIDGFPSVYLWFTGAIMGILYLIKKRQSERSLTIKGNIDHD